MNKIFDGKRYGLLDGAMGTMLQKSGLKLGERPDLLSITDVYKRQAFVPAEPICCRGCKPAPFVLGHVGGALGDGGAQALRCV